MTGPLENNTRFERKLFQLMRSSGSALDIGTGIRPFDRFTYNPHICIEPHWEYVIVLQDKGFIVIQETALVALSMVGQFDIVLLLDVIEHMEKEEGLLVIEQAKNIGKQVVVFTPLGFMAQDCSKDRQDAWGYQGQDWQTHRSGWVPEDFPGWDILIGPKYHETHDAFAAVYNR